MGTSIPKRENELKGAPPSPVKEYRLSPEELAKVQGKPIPKSHSKRIEFEVKTSVPKNEEDVKSMPKVNKDEYLALRVQGSSRKDAAKKLGTSKQSLETYWFKQWGIKNDASEEVEIARYKEQKKKLSEPVTSAPVAAKIEEPVNVPPAQQQAEPERQQPRMSVAIRQWVFNPGLRGKFVRVHGVDGEGAKLELQALVVKVQADRIDLSTFDRGEWVLRLHEFGENGLALEVCDQFTRYEMPADADQTLVE